MQNNSLKNKKIIISAGASGIGLAITKTCLDRGATVLATDINNKFINSLKKNSKYKKKLFLYNFDASEENDVSNFFKSVKSILTDCRNYIKTGCIAISTEANKNTISMFFSIDIFSP